MVRILIGQLSEGDSNSVAITPDGSKAYLTNSYGNSVPVIDTESNTVSSAIGGVGINPAGSAITPDGAFAYPRALSSL